MTSKHFYCHHKALNDHVTNLGILCICLILFIRWQVASTKDKLVRWSGRDFKQRWCYTGRVLCTRRRPLIGGSGTTAIKGNISALWHFVMITSKLHNHFSINNIMKANWPQMIFQWLYEFRKLLVSAQGLNLTHVCQYYNPICIFWIRYIGYMILNTLKNGSFFHSNAKMVMSSC